MSQYCYRDEKGKLVAPAVLRYIADIMDDIAELARTFSLLTTIAKNMPKVEDIINYKNFDDFAESWVDNHFRGHEKFVEKIIHIGRKNYDERSENNLLKYSKLLYFLCIPINLADKLAKVGRNEMTLAIGLLMGIRQLEKDKHYSRYFSEGRTKFELEIKLD